MEANVSPARESRDQLRASNGLSHSEGLFDADPTSTQDAQPDARDRERHGARLHVDRREAEPR
jgi:hypothetical protein